jgi:hypothetical protein
VTIRVGDDAAESHSYARTRNIIKSDGTKWKREVLIEEIKRQLGDAADDLSVHILGNLMAPGPKGEKRLYLKLLGGSSCRVLSKLF